MKEKIYTNMKKQIIILLLIITIFTSCSNKLQNLDKQTNFLNITNKLVKPLCKDIYPHKVLYITDFVNETYLQNKSKLGFLLSNNLKVNILDRSCTTSNVIKSFELGDNVKIGSEGSRIFTRKLDDLATKAIDENNQIFVGTYIFTSKQLILYLKLINLNTKNIISSNTVSIPITDEIKDLEGLKTSYDIIKDNKMKSTNRIYKPFHL
jgi:hypothetical protein